VPEVSVIIPAFNSARYVTAAVDSVLGQTYQDLELLVVDDGSTDDTGAALCRYGASIRVIRQENSGVAVARNRGIAESRGRYIAFLDADDTWSANKLVRQIEEVKRHPGCRFCYSAFTVVDADLRPLAVRRRIWDGPALEGLLLRGNIVGSICTVLCERSLFEGKNGFDPQLSQCADWDMWVRLATQTEFVYVDEPLVTYRQHGTNMSRNAPLMEHDSMLVLEKAFALPDLPERIRARRRRAFGRNYTVLAGTHWHAARYRDFLRCALCAAALDFRQFGYLVTSPLRMAARRWPLSAQATPRS
jgi:glycosyltransferase involved in cell wall biosynthesis